MPDERKQRLLHQHGKKESTFLRLRRTKLGLDDFRTVKVIGKGAFGKVRVIQHKQVRAKLTAGLLSDPLAQTKQLFALKYINKQRPCEIHDEP